MKFLTPLALIALFPLAAAATPAQQAYAAASTTEKLVICAPFLSKYAGLQDLAARKVAEKGDSPKLRELRDSAFNLSYRAETITALYASTHNALLDNAWKMSAAPANRPAYDALLGPCVDLYNREWQAGRISKEVEAREASKINAAQAGWPNTKPPEIPANCRGSVNRRFDVCMDAKFIAESLATTLPAKVSEDLTLASAAAKHKTVSVQVNLGYDKAKFDELTGMDPEVIKQANGYVIAKAKSTVCANSKVALFIENGGTVEYVYTFKDGSSYLTAEVRYCLKKPSQL